jgi:hypothetical protein
MRQKPKFPMHETIRRGNGCLRVLVISLLFLVMFLLFSWMFWKGVLPLIEGNP